MDSRTDAREATIKRLITLTMLLVSGLGALLLTDHDYRAQLRQEYAQDLAQASAETRNHMQVAISTRLRVVEDLQAFMLASAALPDNETFSRFAASVLEHYPDIRALQYIDSQRIIRYIFPLEGNEAAIGLDLMTRPAAPFVEKAVRERRTAVNDPTVTVQGSLSIVARSPLYREDQLIGLVQGVFDVSSILEEVLTEVDPRFAAQLRDSKGNRFWGAETLNDEARPLPVEVGDNAWTLTVGWQVAPPGPARLTLGLIWGVGGALLLSLLFIVDHTWTETERLRATVSERTAALRESEERYRLVFENSGDAILMTGQDGAIYSANPEACRILGRSEAEITQLGRAGVVDTNDPRLQSAFAERKRTGQFKGELNLLRKDGTTFPGELSTTLFKDSRGNERSSMIFRDITERKQMEEQVRQLAFHDQLTNLPNRRLLNDRLSQLMAANKRSGRYGAVMFLDLDNFKLLNDTHGHEVGDLLLIEAADRLKSCVREMDTVARFGGDEFVVILGELDVDKTESAARAGIIAEKIRAALARPYVLQVRDEGGAQTTVEHQSTASIGVALFGRQDVSQGDILTRADRVMYQAKEAGCNLIRFFDQQA